MTLYLVPQASDKRSTQKQEGESRNRKVTALPASQEEAESARVKPMNGEFNSGVWLQKKPEKATKEDDRVEREGETLSM